MKQPPPGGEEGPQLFRTLKSDVRQVAADIRHHGVGPTFFSALEDIEAFYLDEARDDGSPAWDTSNVRAAVSSGSSRAC